MTGPLLFDAGGVLPPGISLVVNNTSTPEPLARLDEHVEADEQQDETD